MDRDSLIGTACATTVMIVLAVIAIVIESC